MNLNKIFDLRWAYITYIIIIQVIRDPHSKKKKKKKRKYIFLKSFEIILR